MSELGRGDLPRTARSLRPVEVHPVSIGTMKERSLHASLKEWYAQPGDRVEAEVDGFVIDICRDGLLVEIQGTAEERPFSTKEMEAMLSLAGEGIASLVEVEKKTVGEISTRKIYHAGHYLEE